MQAVQIDASGNGTVRVAVRNTGARAGSEVVQLYVRPPSGDRPVAELRGFAKVRLAPGEQTYVSLPLTPRDFAWYDAAAHGWRVDAGSYGIRIGRHSRDGVETPVALTASFAPVAD